MGIIPAEMRSLMDWFQKLERKYSKYAIQNLMMYITNMLLPKQSYSKNVTVLFIVNHGMGDIKQILLRIHYLQFLIY